MKKAKVKHRIFKAKSEDKFLDNALAVKDVHSRIKKQHEKKAEENKYLSKVPKENWISEAIKKPGTLHKELGVPTGKKIPKTTLDAAAKEGGKLGERARLAKTLEGMHHKKAEIMENKYLTKLAGDKMRGYISPAWMEHSIAKKEGEQGPKGVVANVGSHVKGGLRIVGRGTVEGAGTGIASGGLMYGVGKLLKMNPAKLEGVALTTGVIGQHIGSIHGAVKSLKNQEKEMHDKYKSQHLSKKAGLASDALNTVKGFAKGAVSDAGKLGDQLHNVKSAYRANGGLLNKGTMSTVQALARNKAVQAGAAVAGTGLVAGKMLSGGQQKQAQENKYLARLA
jgi:hypothetical protein